MYYNELMNVLTVAEFNKVLNTMFSDMGEFSVQGEVISLRITSNRAMFMELKDKKESALLKVTNFAPWVEGLKSIDVGMDVIVHGPMEIYSPSGSMSLKARKIEPVGEGSLKLAFEKLKMLLQQEGLFALERKRKLPKVVQKIALISGKGSAAFADFTKIINENGAAIEIDFYPVLVQGGNSSKEVYQALRVAAKRDYDAICLVRGGGSLEDLQSFNAEVVARAIFGSPIPVITGVGHEVDVTIADMVADVRASTPSQAAYYLVSQNNSFLNEMSQGLLSYLRSLEAQLPPKTDLMRLQQQLWELTAGHYISDKLLSGQMQLMGRVLSDIEKQVYTYVNGLSCVNSWTQELTAKIRLSASKASGQVNLISAYNPQNVLARGYALVGKQGKYLSSQSQINIGDKLNIKFKDGSVETLVSNKFD